MFHVCGNAFCRFASALNYAMSMKAGTLLFPRAATYMYAGALQVGELMLVGRGGTMPSTAIDEFGNVYYPSVLRPVAQRTTLKLLDGAVTAAGIEVLPDGHALKPAQQSFSNYMRRDQNVISVLSNTMRTGARDLVIDGNWEANKELFLPETRSKYGGTTWLDDNFRNAPSWSGFV
jgi:hypothetical protein